MKPEINLKIVPATMADKDFFFRFLKKHFFPEEPLGKSLGLFHESEQGFRLLDVLADGLSFKAVNGSDESEVKFQKFH